MNDDNIEKLNAYMIVFRSKDSAAVRFVRDGE